jgi:hypothetical protein
LEVDVGEIPLAMGTDRCYIFPLGHLDHQRLLRAVYRSARLAQKWPLDNCPVTPLAQLPANPPVLA